ncbi:MAG: hypothetical protein Q7S32_02930 [bacterium]|nr:hypothetical protein [bacterium]
MKLEEIFPAETFPLRAKSSQEVPGENFRVEDTAFYQDPFGASGQVGALSRGIRVSDDHIVFEIAVLANLHDLFSDEIVYFRGAGEDEFRLANKEKDGNFPAEENTKAGLNAVVIDEFMDGQAAGIKSAKWQMVPLS